MEPAEERDFNPSNPSLTLSVGVRTVPSGPRAGAPARVWSWTGPRYSYARWTQDDGALVEQEIGLALGLITRRILADLYGEAEFPLPRRERDREALRTACPPPAPPSG